MIAHLVPLALALVAPAHLAQGAEPGHLGVGDPAPPVEVAEWLHGEPWGDLKRDTVYVLEFWATWCGPCRRSMPHLSELQERFADDVRIAGISIWEQHPSALAPFVRGVAPEISYALARDAQLPGCDGYMASTWMGAAQQDSLPTAFIVDRAGRVAWIGNPSALEEPLVRVVCGNWDIELAAWRHAETLRRGAALRAARAQLKHSQASGDWPAVVAACERLVELDKGQVLFVARSKFSALLALRAFDMAYAYGERLLRGPARDQPGLLNLLAWIIVDPGAAPLERRDLDLALRAASRANETSRGSDPAILDTLALVVFELGDTRRALALQTRAVQLAHGTPLELELVERLALIKRHTE